MPIQDERDAHARTPAFQAPPRNLPSFSLWGSHSKGQSLSYTPTPQTTVTLNNGHSKALVPTHLHSGTRTL